jgi:hypothetical protein
MTSIYSIDNSVETPLVAGDSAMFNCEKYSSSDRYAFGVGHGASYNGILTLGDNEATLHFVETSEGLVVFVVLDMPNSESPTE